MCGFVGFAGESARRDDASEILTKMMNRIIHRGPDMGGQDIRNGVALGFRRLSILDLSEAGAQPMSNADGSVTIIFNGEVYNFQELREQLKAKGYTFKSGTDTEVLLYGYEEWGEDMLNRLRGMYAFVIYDVKRNRLFGARDIFGIKPFYYYRTAKGDLLFGSEIKSFLDHPDFVKQVNHEALRSYMTFQSPVIDEAFFKGVFKLPQAHFFNYDLATGTMDIQRYWESNFSEDTSKSFDEYVDECAEVMRDSVEAHRIADVKVGSFLSGGVDSSYITACLHPDDSFSVGFDYKGFNEMDYAKELSGKIGVKNFRHMINADEFFDALPDIQYHMDEPQSNLASVPLYFLAKLASQHVTVVLSGEGADELFAGYEFYEDTPGVRKFKKIVPGFIRRALGRAVYPLPYFKGRSFLLRSSGIPELYYVGNAYIYRPEEVDRVLKPAYDKGPSAPEVLAPWFKQSEGLPELSRKQQLDMNAWLPGDILLKADKMCMAFSLEQRVPFLDRKVMQFAEHIPVDYRINEQGNKQVLRHAANRILPDEWATRPKLGFPVPVKFWLREQKYYEWVKEYFTAPWASEFFDTDYLMGLLEDHYAGKAWNQRKIYTPLIFLVWYKRFFIDEEAGAPATAQAA